MPHTHTSNLILFVGLVGKLNPIRIERESSACASWSLCAKRRPMGIDVDEATRVSAVERHTCLQCVGSCPSSKALDLKLVLPGVRQVASERAAALPTVAM